MLISKLKRVSGWHTKYGRPVPAKSEDGEEFHVLDWVSAQSLSNTAPVLALDAFFANLASTPRV
jgi:hypothetical protein